MKRGIDILMVARWKGLLKLLKLLSRHSYWRIRPGMICLMRIFEFQEQVYMEG